VRRFFAGLIGVAGLSVVGVFLTAGSATPAFADSQPYELICPGTPVGTVVINDVVTSATITPASPAAGQQFNVTNYGTKLTLVSQIAKAAVAIQPNIQGTATATLDASGATPSTLAAPSININTAIPDGGVNGVPLALPASPESVGPFTASGGTITISQDKTSQLTLVIGGSPLNTTCTAYPNNSNATGLKTAGSAVSGAAAAPVIATASSTGAATPTTVATAAATPTTAAPVTAAATGTPLPSTGAGPGLMVVLVLGSGLVCGAVALIGVDVTRRRMVRRLQRESRRH